MSEIKAESEADSGEHYTESDSDKGDSDNIQGSVDSSDDGDSDGADDRKHYGSLLSSDKESENDGNTAKSGRRAVAGKGRGRGQATRVAISKRSSFLLVARGLFRSLL